MREFCIEWRHVLESLAARLMVHRADVDDAVQETLLALWTRRRTYDPARAAWPWLTQILRRRCHDLWRKQVGRSKRGAPVLLPLEQVEWVPSPGPAPCDELERNELTCMARACLADLPPTIREVIQLAILEEISEDEIAALLCIAKGTVKSRKHRGIRMLRARSEKEEMK